MHFLFIFLYDSGFLENFLEELLQQEVEEVFVAEAQQLKEILAFRIPLFKELQTVIGTTRKESKIIFALVKEEKTIEKMIKNWKEEMDLEKEEIATIMSFPVKVWHISPHVY
ncbi:hypothetical protein H5U35_08885 [Candidatus Aerophobetes bacterium]|nr:hypothetical protein [Candidatus Aerophobetes bacterium]